MNGVIEGEIVAMMPQDSAVATRVRIMGMDRYELDSGGCKPVPVTTNVKPLTAG